MVNLRLFDADTFKDQPPRYFLSFLENLNVAPGPAWPDRFGQALARWLSSRGHTPIRTLSLFSGGGGLDIAFHECGFDVVQMVEIETKYVETLRANVDPGAILSGSSTVCTDIRDYIPPTDMQVDFIIGGPPCQTFSAAGRRAAGVLGTSDPRGTLFGEYVRLLRTLQPKGFLFENVYGITGAQGGAAWREIQAAFQDAGYRIFWRVLDAADYGVPQHRERLFIVGVKDGDYEFPRPTHGPDSPDLQPHYTAEEAVGGISSSALSEGIGGKYGHLLDDIPPGLNYSFYTKEMGYPYPIFSWRSKFSDFLYKADPNRPVRTVKAQGGQYTGPFSWENRRFTVTELKRLQTFPDTYRIVGGRQVAIEQIGNSVPPQIGRLLALSVLDQIFGAALPLSLQYLPPHTELGFRQRKRFLTAAYARKAKQAIDQLQRENRLAPKPTESAEAEGMIERTLSSDFGWTEVSKSAGISLTISYKIGDNSWTFRASTGDVGVTQPDRLTVTVVPMPGEEWTLGTRQVVLSTPNAEPLVFTSLWKAFEEKLSEVTGKADLVQLSGYYQYPARISMRMAIAADNTDPIMLVLRHVVEGIGVAVQAPRRRLSMIWGVDEGSVLPYLKSLRGMGFEVRDHHTNPQIPKGEYLIPYSFPTLNPRSVQLRKQLGDENE